VPRVPLDLRVLRVTTALWVPSEVQDLEEILDQLERWDLTDLPDQLELQVHRVQQVQLDLAGRLDLRERLGQPESRDR